VDEEERKAREYQQMMDDLGAADNYRNEDNVDMSDEEDKKEEALMTAELENFFRIFHNHNIPEISQHTIDEWQNFVVDTHNALDKDDKEVDMEGVRRKVDELLLSAGVSDRRAYNPDKHSSPLDYFEMVLEEAKISPYKQELEDLFTGWKTDPHKMSAYTVLAGVERIAHEKGLYLMLEWMSGSDPTDEDAVDDNYHESDHAKDIEEAKAAGLEVPESAEEHRAILEKALAAKQAAAGGGEPHQAGGEPQQAVAGGEQQAGGEPQQAAVGGEQQQ
jgi:hypothetical protein